ncbi:uncharacterized protein LOC111615448 [Centruroides sculpturatus]|nr:uncharacterized protein LOC111615448 [Centruroides sculpturatus]
MERQFNRKQGARERKFTTKELVYARHRRSQNWQPGTIKCKTGNTVYEVEMADGSTRRFHSNQLLRRQSSRPQPEDDPLAVIAEAFSIPLRPAPTPDSTHPVERPAQQDDESPPFERPCTVEETPPERSTPQPPRRSARTRVPMGRLQIIPYRKNYYAA